MANKTVEEIVEKAKSGDKSAFDLLYREYSEKLLKYVVKLGVDSYDAEDIVSESFMEAIEHIGDLKNNAFFSTWLHTIAKNKVYTMKKKEQKHARVDFSSDEGDEQNDALDVAAAKAAEYNGDTVMLPEDYAENEEVKQILADTINSLNSDQRDAVYLFYYKNNSISEIAEQAGVSENTIKSRLSLARKYMERKLKKLQKNGVVLCAVPIPVILNIVVSESKLKAAAPVVTTAAGGATSGAAVSAVSGKIGALIAAGIMIGGGVGIYSTLSDRSGNIRKGDTRTADSSSVMISDESSIDSRKDWDPDLIKVVDTDTVESTIAVDDASSQTDNRPTNTNQGNTRTVQQGQQAQPAQQVITYYDDAVENVEGGEEGGENSDQSENNGESKEYNATDYLLYESIDENSIRITQAYNEANKEYVFPNKELIIPEYIDGKMVTEIDSKAFWYNDIIESVIIPNGVTTIGKSAFKECHNLRSIHFSNNLYMIEGEAFAGCYNLESIYLPDSLTIIGENVFGGCSRLKELFIPPKITYLNSNAFWQCTGLEKVTLNEGLEIIGSAAFSNCEKLNSIDIPNSVTYIESYAFDNCTNLTSVKISENLEVIDEQAFFHCPKLTSLELPRSVYFVGDYAIGYLYEDYYIAKYYLLKDFKLKCYKDSAAHKYAIANGINVELLD